MFASDFSWSGYKLEPKIKLTDIGLTGVGDWVCLSYKPKENSPIHDVFMF